MKALAKQWQAISLGGLTVSALLILFWSLFFRPGGEFYMPHAHCYLMNPGLIRLHGISDFLIGVSYVAISATLTYVVLRSRRELPFHWMMLAFATFIVACGGTHFVEVWTLQHENPPYWFAGDVKLITAFASVATAILLPPLVPKIRALLEQARLSSHRQAELTSAHRLLEEAHAHVQQLDQLKTNFFANISHELRTPVTLIVGPVDRLLAERELNGSIRTELEVVRRNALLLHKHVDDLLEVSRIEAGKLQLRYTRTDLASLVRLVASYFGSSRARPLHLQIEAPDELAAEIDADKIERVLLNLTSNAYKFAPETGTVTVRLREEARCAVITVEDTGPGVPVEMRTSIFERFNQGSNPTSRGGAGTGLGLSIVKEFVELHGGTIRVDDREGGGARFEVRLPRYAPPGAEVQTATERPASLYAQGAGLPDGPASPTNSAPAEDGGDADRPLILLAEDNADMSEHIRRTLAPEFRVRRARDGAEALRLAETEKPDLILTDLMMPGMDGSALLDEVRRRPQFSAIPVILLTARADEEIRLKLLQRGAQDYVLKPFGAEELRARVRNQVTTKRVRDTLQTELATQELDVARLAKEVTVRARELERAKEQAEKANRAKDQFLAVLSHELRTPLTPVLAAAINLESDSTIPPEQLRASLAMIRRNVELEARLIDDLLNLTRIERGKLHLEFGTVDVHVAIQHAIELCRSDVLQKGTVLALQLEAANPRVRGDAPRLLQIVWNLVLNAVKFTPAGGQITVRTRNLGERLVIGVEDNGIGISADSLQRIFEPFEQGDPSTGGRLGGLGLGLAVAKGLVEAHGGAISALSEGMGCGAEFVIELPTLPADAAAPLSPPSAASAAPATVALRILLVEDHVDTRETLTRLMRRWGHEVDSVGSVAEALALPDCERFHLLVSDIGLPDGTGHDVMIELKRRSPSLIGVAMSGFGMEEDLMRSHQAGFIRHLTKPVGAQLLQAVISEIAQPQGK
jgi:signal transduction histidine kinase